MTTFNFKNIQCSNVQFGDNNIMNIDNRDSVFVQENVTYYLEEHIRPIDCQGCGFVNPVENKVCEYCGRVL
jgi:hypothetical protein